MFFVGLVFFEFCYLLFYLLFFKDTLTVSL